MYIYLDESKGFFWEKKKIVFWWLLTNLKPSVIDRIYYEFLDSVWIKESWWEVKSNNSRYKNKIFDFYKFLKNKKEYRDIEFIWAYCGNYSEDWEKFYQILTEIFKRSLIWNKFNLEKIRDVHIISDMIKFSFTNKDIEKSLKIDLSIWNIRKKFNIQKISFDFVDSKRYWWIKFSDFIAWILRKKYIGKESLEEEFIEMFVREDILIVKFK